MVDLGLDPVTDGAAIWYHALAIMYSPKYIAENADAVRFGWPRVPLPASANGLLDSATLGREVAALLESDTALQRAEIRVGAITSARDDGNLRMSEDDLALTVGWGFVGKGGATMAGGGKVHQRSRSEVEWNALDEAATRLGVDREVVSQILGETTFDVYLNDHAFWSNVPSRVWACTIGGYQVLKKWLSYREQEVLGRALTKHEARSFGHIATRIASLLLRERDTDRNYDTIVADIRDWNGGQ